MKIQKDLLTFMKDPERLHSIKIETNVKRSSMSDLIHCFEKLFLYVFDLGVLALKY